MKIGTRVAGELADRLDELAALRIAVFREWPYLYHGTVEYERGYLSTYLENERARIVTAEDDGRLVGISTCLPLADEVEEFRRPLERAGWDPAKGFYFGESVLLPEHRGRGIGRAFMEARLEAARAHGGMEFCCFCAVRRDADDPRKPEVYRPLDGFWRKMGFAPMEGVEAVFEWREVGGTGEAPHVMDFWSRTLEAR
jgi:GNAT superfamily N-acetyltransferase